MAGARKTGMRLEPEEGGFAIDGADLAALFGADEATIRREMGEGRITTRVEKGEDEDAGAWRVTFRRGGERVRLTVDDAGRELRRSRVSWAAPRPEGGES
ncbi:MAG: DUF6522 family protein [Pseudomonadota bacterium]